tara:strand:+ start:46547 stop:46813 length:267 start_codon:yes stop_codon:yes gene_type:complete
MKNFFALLYLTTLVTFGIFEIYFDFGFIIDSIFPTIGFIIFNFFMYFLQKDNNFEENFSKNEIRILYFCKILINANIFLIIYSFFNFL